MVFLLPVAMVGAGSLEEAELVFIDMAEMYILPIILISYQSKYSYLYFSDEETEVRKAF